MQCCCVSLLSTPLLSSVRFSTDPNCTPSDCVTEFAFDFASDTAHLNASSL